MKSHLIESTGYLLDDEGRLREPGYALRPLFYYDHRQIKASPLRVKDWDYYLVNDDSYAVALTFSDMGYVGLVSASVMDFAEGSFKTTSETVPMPLGRMGLPPSSDVGDIDWENGRCRVHFVHEGDRRRISFYMAGFDGDDELEVELSLTNQPRDSMVICTPWAEYEHAFYYNRKIIGMSAQGAFRRGALFHVFRPDEQGASGASFALLDWGRGVWTHDNVWYWAAAQGLQDGPDGKRHVVGLNLGYGFGDTSAATENMAFVDGIAHKLENVDFGIPPAPDGSGYAYLEPWHMTDDQGRLELTFAPEIDRTDHMNALGIIATDQHQVFGRLSGTIVLDDGTAFPICGLRGSAEHIHNRY